MMNILNGGNTQIITLIYKFMVMFGPGNLTECLQMGVEVFHSLKAVLKAKVKYCCG